MLDLRKLDLEQLCMALEDNSPEMEWWFDPQTGEAIPRSEGISWEEVAVDDPDRLIALEPIPSDEAYRDMEDFVGALGDARARDLLGRAISGRGAFRRFKDTLLEFPDLRDAWFSFHDARMRRRAVEWLVANGLLDRQAADAGLERIEVPLPAGGSGHRDAREIAAAVAGDLRELYGPRLRQVLLFGSWARGDAHPESDIDLLVVLDHVESSWAERQRMNEILWHHSFDNDAVVTAFAVSEHDFEDGRRPVLVRARAEGVSVA